ncbi:AMP-binding protein [Nocardia sp. NPDC052566]|uniref:AMP-binding protein n=1 Tax=Nocardia sp. NPDC052566 TaxID=3364330 RepID=UPI0037CC25C3
MNDRKDVAAVRNWLVRPAHSTGIHLADEADGWTYSTYTDLAEQAWAIAALMRSHGLGGGEAVCVLMPTGFPCAAAFYAVWACGGVCTPIGPPLFGDAVRATGHTAAILAQAKPRLVLTTPEFADLVHGAMRAAGRTDEPLVITEESLRHPPAVRELGEPGECALLQFTSGSTGVPRGVRISWRNLATNIAMISRLIDWRTGESLVSWLPLYHDMGLVGAFLTTVTNQGDLYLMRPDQFVRDPLRWLRAMANAQHAPSPSFALGYAAHRIRSEEIAGLDLSGWRTLAVGSDPIQVADLEAFADLTGRQGFSMNAYTLAYGLAEATVLVCASVRQQPITALRIDTATLRFGEPVTVLDEELLDDTHRLDGAGWLTGLGSSTAESTITVVGADGHQLPDGTLGELVVAGQSVALGYSNEFDRSGGPGGCGGQIGAGGATRIVDGTLFTGDAGFRYRGEVFVLGRMGTSLKVRGRSIFMEDIESRVAAETGVPRGKLAAVAITEPGADGIALFAEVAPGDWITQARRIIRAELGPALTVSIVTGPVGSIRRTSSGKPRRRHMWQLLCSGELERTTMHDADMDSPMRATDAGSRAHETVASRPADDASAETSGMPNSEPGSSVTPGHRVDDSPSLAGERMRRLLEMSLESVAVLPDSAVLLEGSLAEGFGNAGSDVDFLVIERGDEKLPTLPTVLFIDGRRVEVRTRSEGQLRRQLARVAAAAAAAELDEDLLNRCQRFLRATVVRAGVVDIERLRAPVPYSAFTTLMTDWWTGRARQALRFAVALRALGARDEALGWMRDGLLQAMKGWAAWRGEGYLETKWLPRQLDRIGHDALVDRYRELADPCVWDRAVSQPESPPEAHGEIAAGARDTTWQQALELAAALGVTGVADDRDQVLFARVPKVTTWAIGPRVHVIRGDRDVFVLSDRGARAWRSVVFGHSLHAVLARSPEDIGADLAEFIRLGLVGLRWRGAESIGDEPITPALAMCKPVAPYTPIPSASTPAVGITGAARDEAIATLSPLPADRFTGCALDLIWSNIVLENAREDLAGAVKDAQGGVADIAAHRMIAMGVRVLLSACGIHPLPADVAPAATLRRLLPFGVTRRAALLATLESAEQQRFSELIAAGGDTIAAVTVLDEFVTSVRSVAGGVGFPASFDSGEQWRRTLAVGYDWLRVAGYLDTELPLDEARDLLTSGGRQPHLRKGGP